MEQNETLKLGEILCAEGLIKRKQLSDALEAQKTDKRKLGQLLVDKGWVDDAKLTEVLSGIFQLPYVKLSEVAVDHKALEKVPQDLMRLYKVFPVALQDNCLTLATNNPLDISALQEVQFKTGCLVTPVMAGLQDIEDHLLEYTSPLDAMRAIHSVENKDTEGAPVAQLVDSIISNAIREKASDIHFEPQHDCMRVRFRIDGVLYEKKPIPKELERNVVSRIKIISGMDVAESRRPQDGRTTLVRGHDEYDIRLSSLPDILGENLVLRILSKKFVNHSFSTLGMDDDQAALMTKLMNHPHGLILVTGPTGAGKTTTLYSVLNRLNETSHNIISVEDPVEYEIAGITQTASNPFTGYTFANAIRHILRHDPDIIMVGEIRDVETAEMAIRAALTGHLVLSTMHTNTAAGAITRLIEMGIEPFLISSAINGVIAQRLVRNVCPHCHEEYSPTAEVVENIKALVPVKEGQKLARPVGCAKCFDTGYQGRTGIYEIFELDREMRAMIIKNASEKELVDNIVSKGMKTLRMAGLNKALNKTTNIEEVLRITFKE